MSVPLRDSKELSILRFSSQDVSLTNTGVFPFIICAETQLGRAHINADIQNIVTLDENQLLTCHACIVMLHNLHGHVQHVESWPEVCMYV